MTKKSYETCCVSANGDDIMDMVDSAREITYETFVKHVGTQEASSVLGYPYGRERGLKLKNDWHVRYHKSTYKGKPCVFAVHSAIEYVFV